MLPRRGRDFSDYWVDRDNQRRRKDLEAQAEIQEKRRQRAAGRQRRWQIREEEEAAARRKQISWRQLAARASGGPRTPEMRALIREAEQRRRGQAGQPILYDEMGEAIEQYDDEEAGERYDDEEAGEQYDGEEAGEQDDDEEASEQSNDEKLEPLWRRSTTVRQDALKQIKVALAAARAIKTRARQAVTAQDEELSSETQAAKAAGDL